VLAALAMAKNQAAKVHTMIMGPEDFGEWNRRPRRMLVLMNRRTMLFTSSLSKFADIFFRQSNPNGEKGTMFWAAPEELVHAELEAAASRAGVVSVSDWYESLPVGGAARLNDYRDRYRAQAHESEVQEQRHIASAAHVDDSLDAELELQERQRPIPAYQQTSTSLAHRPDYNCISDCNQNMGVRGGLTTHVPVLLRHGTIFNFIKQRPLIGMEHLLAQHAPVFGSVSHGGLYEVPCLEHLQKLTSCQLKQLAGNGINCRVFGALFLFIMATATLRKDDPMVSIPLHISSSSVTDVVDSEDEECDHVNAKRSRAQELATPAWLSTQNLAGNEGIRNSTASRHDQSQASSSSARASDGCFVNKRSRKN
jgi:hypothetical protein